MPNLVGAIEGQAVKTPIDQNANKYQNLSITRNYFSNNATTDRWDLASIAAKISVLVFPIILLLTLFADLVLFEQPLCSKKSHPDIDVKALQACLFKDTLHGLDDVDAINSSNSDEAEVKLERPLRNITLEQANKIKSDFCKLYPDMDFPGYAPHIKINSSMSSSSNRY